MWSVDFDENDEIRQGGSAGSEKINNLFRKYHLQIEGQYSKLTYMNQERRNATMKWSFTVKEQDIDDMIYGVDEAVIFSER